MTSAADPVALAIFVLFAIATLAITSFAHRRTHTAAQFYVADGLIKPWQNGLAIAGDFLSAGSFLGTISVFYTYGVDGLLYTVGAAAGWPVVTSLIAERLRSWGRYTFADALAYRIKGGGIRILTALSTVLICGTYLIAQMVGAGTLIQLLFGIPYIAATCLVGALMTIYVLFGGMVATTWIQMTKALLLVGAGIAMALLVLARFGFSMSALVNAAALTRNVPAMFLRSQGLLSNPIDAIGLALAFVFGPAGMPHILMRFFTVKGPKSARTSLVYASSLIVIFQILLVVLGFGAIALVKGSTGSTANMAALQLARVIGGNALYGGVAAITFATILAVVSGLTLTAASAVSHDLFSQVLRLDRTDESRELRVSRISTIIVGLSAIALGILFRNLNIGFLATLPLVLAASCNFPILLLAMYWRPLTSQGAVWGGATGLFLGLVLIGLGPKVWVKVLGHTTALLSFDYPTLISLGAAFGVATVLSLTKSPRVPLESSPVPQ